VAATNQATPCNLYLKCIGKSETDKCPKCNELDDIVHYFVVCPEVKSLWKQLGIWWNGITNQSITISERDVMIGLENRAIKLKMHEQLGKILLAAKWKLYVNNQLGQDTCFYQIMCAIRSMIEIQKLIAERKQKVENHNEVWGQIEDYLT
jgi:hypothetical protein